MKTATASNGTAAVQVGAFRDGTIFLNKYAPSSIGSEVNRAEFDALFTKAAAKLGSKPDRRFKNGWKRACA